MRVRAPWMINKRVAPWSLSKSLHSAPKWLWGTSSGLIGNLMKDKLVDCSKWGLWRWCMPFHVSKVRQTSSGPRISCQTLWSLLSWLAAMLVQVHHLVEIMGRWTSCWRCWGYSWHEIILCYTMESHGSQRIPYKCQYDPMVGLGPS